MSQRTYHLGRLRRVTLEMADGMRIVCHNPGPSSDASVTVEIERLETFSSRSGVSVRDLDVISRTQTHATINLNQIETLEVENGQIKRDGSDLARDLREGGGPEPEPSRGEDYNPMFFLGD